ncbi:MAG: ABC transporter ATP-binding protein [Firmicutes bacterium]|nr:ABC transporter ATP-binding protein [Bacillota bacterium]
MNIEIRNVEKYYGDNQVLDIDYLNIEKEKITGITGPNGCGKTTLLNIIGGLDKEFLGEVFYDNNKFSKKVKQAMTIVFQKPYLLKRTVYENIEYPLKLRNMNKKESKAKVLDVMKKLEITDLMDKRGNKLSGGESQKVALARALVFNPKLLLLDEPTSNIDPEYIVTMENAITQFNLKNKGTIIIVTHNIQQSERLCHAVINMNRGKIQT